MSNIAVVVDSTSDIPKSLAERLAIKVIPLSVIHKGIVYKDGVDLTPGEFYPMLEKATVLPTSSQPSPKEFVDIFEPLLESGKHVLSFHLSKVLSSTVDSAKIAAEQLEPKCIHIVDTGSISYGVAVQAIEAARLAEKGKTASAILKSIARLRKRSEILFSLDTMHYLAKGGRIGKVSSLLGNLLNIKPIVHVDNGVYTPVGKVRSMRQALSGMLDFLEKKFGKSKVSIAVGHGQGLNYAKNLMKLAVSRLNVAEEPVLYEVGPVIGVHTGPGTVGITVRALEY